MPAVRKLPDSTTLRRLRAQDWTLAQIAETYGVTTSAVHRALVRANYTLPLKTWKDILPEEWDIADEHKATAIMERFRSIVKQQKGAQLRANEEHLLNQWLRDLKDNDVVVAYHKDAPPNDASRKGGFYYTQRRPDDDWIVRRNHPTVS